MAFVHDEAARLGMLTVSIKRRNVECVFSIIKQIVIIGGKNRVQEIYLYESVRGGGQQWPSQVSVTSGVEATRRQNLTPVMVGAYPGECFRMFG